MIQLVISIVASVAGLVLGSGRVTNKIVLKVLQVIVTIFQLLDDKGTTARDKLDTYLPSPFRKSGSVKLELPRS